MNRDLEIPIEMLIEETIEKVVEYIANKLENGFMFQEKMFPMSISDQVNYTNLLLLPNEAFPQNFPCKDHFTFQVTVQNKLALYQASAQHKMLWEGIQSKVISQLKKCTNNLEVIEIYKTYCTN